MLCGQAGAGSAASLLSSVAMGVNHVAFFASFMWMRRASVETRSAIGNTRMRASLGCQRLRLRLFSIVGRVATPARCTQPKLAADTTWLTLIVTARTRWPPFLHPL